MLSIPENFNIFYYFFEILTIKRYNISSKILFFLTIKSHRNLLIIFIYSRYNIFLNLISNHLPKFLVINFLYYFMSNYQSFDFQYHIFIPYRLENMFNQFLFFHYSLFLLFACIDVDVDIRVFAVLDGYVYVAWLGR